MPTALVQLDQMNRRINLCRLHQERVQRKGSATLIQKRQFQARSAVWLSPPNANQTQRRLKRKRSRVRNQLFLVQQKLQTHLMHSGSIQHLAVRQSILELTIRFAEWVCENH